MIELVTEAEYQRYWDEKDSEVQSWFADSSVDSESQRWHIYSSRKRYIFSLLYGDLVTGDTKDKLVLDIGAGSCAPMIEIGKSNKYCVVDQSEQPSLNGVLQLQRSWDTLRATDSWDILICNDLFPNVDQRLDMFLDKFYPICREIRMSLTFFNRPKWYKARRLDGDEILTVKAWDATDLFLSLDDYWNYLCEEDWVDSHESIFDNGRQVLVIKLPGGAA